MQQRQKEGSRVEFKCNVQGNRKVLYQWVKDGTEMQGQNSSSLVLGCVEMRDFGCYACHVSDPNADYIKSSAAAVLDVAPGDGTGQCYDLNCIILKKNTYFFPSRISVTTGQEMFRKKSSSLSG